MEDSEVLLGLLTQAQLSFSADVQLLSGSDCVTLNGRMSGWGRRARFHVGTWSRRSDKQTQGQLSVKPPNCHDKGEGERVDPPIHPHTFFFFFLTALPTNQPTTFLPHTLLQAQLTHLPKMSRQTCTKTSSHTGPHSWTSTQTRTHTSTPPVNQTHECHAVTDNVKKKRKKKKIWKVSHLIAR